MLIGDARELLNSLRAISQKLGTDAALSNTEMETLEEIDDAIEHARNDCDDTLQAIEAIDHSGVDKVLGAKKLDRAALKKEVDEIVSVLEAFD